MWDSTKIRRDVSPEGVRGSQRNVTMTFLRTKSIYESSLTEKLEGKGYW